jgi:hypothetical protein
MATTERVANATQVAREIVDFVAANAQPENWVDELEDFGRLAILDEAETRFGELRREYAALSAAGLSREDIFAGFGSGNRISLVEYVARTMLACVTGRGERGPYQKRQLEQEEV